jgi:hypothetical protein
MSTSRRKGFRAIAVFLAFALAQVYVQLSFAAPNSSGSTVLPQQLVAVLTSTGGSAVINGNSASTGATVLSGAEVEAPAGVRVSINLGRLGKVDLDPGSKIRLYYECSQTTPESCTVKAVVLAGCVHVATEQGTRGQIDTATDENVAKNETGGGAAITHCAGAVVGQQAPATAVGEGLSTAAKVAIVVAAVSVPAALFWAFNGGDNPSPGAP